MTILTITVLLIMLAVSLILAGYWRIQHKATQALLILTEQKLLLTLKAIGEAEDARKELKKMEEDHHTARTLNTVPNAGLWS